MEKCWALSVWRIASTQTFRTSWYCVFDNVEKMLPQQTGQVSQAQISDWPEFSVFESHKPRYISLGLPAQTFWSNAYFPMVICPWRGQIAGDVTGPFPRVTNWFGDRASCTFMHILNQKLLGSQHNWEETCQGFPSTNVSTVPPSHVVPKCQFMWCLNEKSIVQTFIMGCKLLHEMPSPKRLTVLGTSWHPEESLSWKRKACIPICYIHLHPPQTCSQFLHAWMAYVMTHSTDQHGIPVMQIQYQKGIFKKSSIGNHQKSCSSPFSPFTVNIRTVNICELYWHRIIIGSS